MFCVGRNVTKEQEDESKNQKEGSKKLLSEPFVLHDVFNLVIAIHSCSMGTY